LGKPELPHQGIVDIWQSTERTRIMPDQLRTAAGQPEHPTEIRTTSARQAVAGLGVRYVLGIGLALVVIAFVIIWITNFR
jgi:hypothetical protein